MRIFIAGCARSGTGLTLALMNCFASIYVHAKEAHVKYLIQLDRNETHLVVKRMAGSYYALADLPGGIELLYCLRHPFDVLTSSHPQSKDIRRFHVTPDRWLNEYEALLQLRERQPRRAILFSKYEDLLADPDATQTRMAALFGLIPIRPFSADPQNPIRLSSLRKWERDGELVAYLTQLPRPFMESVADFCDEFGYELPDWSLRVIDGIPGR